MVETKALAMRPAEDLDTMTLGKVLAESGYFGDAKSQGQAIVKVLAGRELGFGPIASMSGIYIVQGRVTLSATLMAAAIKRSGRYTYRVKRLDSDACEVEFFEGSQSIGLSSFTTADATTAGLQGKDTWQKFKRNMLFARALSNGARWYCPDIFGGPVYTPEEMGAPADPETGEIIIPAAPTQSPQPPPAPTSQPAPAQAAEPLPQTTLDLLKSWTDQLDKASTLEEVEAIGGRLAMAKKHNMIPGAAYERIKAAGQSRKAAVEQAAAAALAASTPAA